MTRPLTLLLAAALAGAALAHRRDLRETQGVLGAALRAAGAYRHDLQRAQQSELRYRVELERARTPLAPASDLPAREAAWEEVQRLRRERGGFRSWAEIQSERDGWSLPDVLTFEARP